MNIFDNVTFSAPTGPTRLGIHSVEGFGKTTLLCHMPNPLILTHENGIPRDLGFSVARVTPEKWMDVFDLVGDLTEKDHDYQTLAVDTIDWLEPHIHRFVCDRDTNRKTEMNPKGHVLESIEDYGWGKGFVVAEEEFRKFISVLDVMQAKRGIHVAFSMHSKVGTFKNPSGPDFDRWEPKPHQRIARVVTEYVENLLFGFFQVDSSKISADVQRNEKTARAKGIGSGVRMIGAQYNAMYDAKNRMRLDAEFEYGEPAQLVPLLLGEHVVAQTYARIEPRSRTETQAVPQSTGPERSPSYPSTQRRDVPPPQQTNGASSPQQRRNDNVPTPASYSDPQQPAAPAPAQQRSTRRAPADTDWTPPTTPASNGQQQQAPRNEHDQNEYANGPGTTNGVAPNSLDIALNHALHHPKGGQQYRKKIDSWVAKAEGVPARIAAIVKQVGIDLQVEIAA